MVLSRSGIANLHMLGSEYVNTCVGDILVVCITTIYVYM